MIIPKSGSTWMSADGNRFRVIDSIFLEEDGHQWVHYMRVENSNIYSCYLESFLERFREVQDDSSRRVR